MRLVTSAAALLLAATLAPSPLLADSVTFKNGDKLTGKIGTITGDSMKLHTDGLGDVSVKMSEVADYKIDTPAVVEPKSGGTLLGDVSGTKDTVKVGDDSYPLAQIKYVNPPEEKWHGQVIANFALARGNTNKFTAGAVADLNKRRDNWQNDDRFTFHAEYNYGRSGGGSGNQPPVVDTDNWMGFGKYDRFWTDKLYGYVTAKIEHDTVADLDYRISPGIGLGYQWLETPKDHFNTEAGFSYVREAYGNDGSTDYVSLRLAYHYDHQFNDYVNAFHNLEWLPAIDDPSDYNLTTDAGLNVKVWGNLTSNFRVEYKRDSTPAEAALKNDLQFMLGFGYSF